MPKRFPAESRRDIVAPALQSDQSIAAIVRSFGVSASCPSRWLRIADEHDSISPVTTTRVPDAAADLEVENGELSRRTKQLN